MTVWQRIAIENWTLIPEEQARPLRGLGVWLADNGEAIRGTRPWDIPSTETSEGTQVRFTQKDGVLYAILLDLPGRRSFSLRGIDASSIREAALLGADESLPVTHDGDLTMFTLPERVPVQAAYALRLGRGVRAIP